MANNIFPTLNGRSETATIIRDSVIAWTVDNFFLNTIFFSNCEYRAEITPYYTNLRVA